MRGGIAFRLYKINPDAVGFLNDLFNQTNNISIHYETYRSKKSIKLFFEIKNTEKNDYGRTINLYLDRIQFMPTKDDANKPVKITPVYQMQILENKSNFQNHLLIFGNKGIDYSIKNAFEKHIESVSSSVPIPLTLIKPDFRKLKELIKEFPNLQQFCIKDVGDDQIDDIILKGTKLEKNTNFARYAIDKDTKGDVNFVGLSNNNKIIYVGRDGSFYSREQFSKTNIPELIYNFLNRLDKIDVLNYSTLDKHV
jgi:hypothetical protein